MPGCKVCRELPPLFQRDRRRYLCDLGEHGSHVGRLGWSFRNVSKQIGEIGHDNAGGQYTCWLSRSRPGARRIATGFDSCSNRRRSMNANCPACFHAMAWSQNGTNGNRDARDQALVRGQGSAAPSPGRAAFSGKGSGCGAGLHRDACRGQYVALEFRDLASYRLLVFGFALMVLMIFRPQGILVPPGRR